MSPLQMMTYHWFHHSPGLIRDMKWRVHGLGMIQLYLPQDMRLHYWDEQFKTEEASPIHNHAWDLHSTVLFGQIINRNYFANTSSANPTHWIGTITPGPKPAPRRLMTAHISAFEEIRLEANQGYSLSNDELHSSEHAGPTATIVKRGQRKSIDEVQVAWEIDKEFGSAVPRSATRDEIDHSIEMIHGNLYNMLG